MSCIIDNGFALGCNSIGGIEKVYIGTYNPDVVYTLDVDNIVTAATAGGTVYLFEQDIEFAGLTQTGQFSRENGTVFYESTLSVKFVDLNAALRNTVLALAKAPIFAIVKSNTGNFFILGVQSPGRATEGTSSLGLAMGDMNGASMTFTFKSQDGAFLLDEPVLGTDIVIG